MEHIVTDDFDHLIDKGSNKACLFLDWKPTYQFLFESKIADLEIHLTVSLFSMFYVELVFYLSLLSRLVYMGIFLKRFGMFIL